MIVDGEEYKGELQTELTQWLSPRDEDARSK